MGKREDLHELLCRILGSRNVYFQPPASIHMEYPAVVYSLSDILVTPANNAPYWKKKAYEIILIDKNPDNTFVDAISDLPYCRFVRPYVADNLNHYVFHLYY